MKNLSAIPRISLTETFTILITLVVCLAGFTEAEVHKNCRKRDCDEQEENYNIGEVSLNLNVPYAHQMSKMTENKLDFPLGRLIKRNSDDLGEFAESDEKESDGYGYDDDEYYHFNFKRNDENLESTKLAKEGMHDSKEKEGVSGQKLLDQNAKEKTKETEKIEMLNYKETHPNLDKNGNPTTVENKKSLSDELSRKKVPSSSLKMSDLKETSAVDEKMKDNKDESSLTSGFSETKASDAKKTIKATEDKDAMKLKESKLTENSEQKEKVASLKDSKEAVVGKSIKENTKSMEEKEKGVKLSDSSKSEDNFEHINGKTNENDSPKISKEDTEIAGYSDKVSSDVINPNGLSELNNRVNFGNNEYKDTMDVLKVAEIEEDEKPSEKSCGMENNAGLSDYQDYFRSPEKLRKYYIQRGVSGSQGYESLNARKNNPQTSRDVQKLKEYPQVKFEVKNLSGNDLLKKDWNEVGLEALKFLTQQPVRQQVLTQDQQRYVQLQHQMSPEEQLGQHKEDINSEPRFKSTFELNFPQNELENTEYHKNYLKSLKKYKSLNSEQKGIMSHTSNSGASRANLHDESKNTKKEIQESVKRRSMETPLEEKENAQSQRTKLRRNTYKADSVLSPRKSETIQALSKHSKEDAKLTKVKKQEELQESNRARRKSPLILEYEIKVINQSPQDSKNAEFSHMAQRRFEKDLKTKLATDEKYLKKYPYSQVSRDDLMRLGEAHTIIDSLEGEKKFKRKAPVWKRCNKKSIIQSRAVPSGYYSNRVKFGQKNFAKNNDRDNSDPSSLDTVHVSSAHLTSDFPSSPMEKNKLQRSWEVRQQDYKHDPMKRNDMKSRCMNRGNPLLLVRKGQRTAITFEEGSRPDSYSNLNADNIVKMLSKDNDYIVLKKTDSNRFQKISDNNPLNAIHKDTGGVNYSKPVKEGGQRESIISNVKQSLKNKGLYVRSFHLGKEDKKFSSASHSSMSNLKKTFDKFRDLAGFFKDNEQESTDNQYSAQELKEGRDIVFSEDKLPDPIVISNDVNEKNTALNQKQQNSIYSISTNFKTLDKQDKKSEMPTNTESDSNMYTAEAKNDNSDSSLELALKNIFPEVKSINTVSKNGNEIIILDLNRNQLKTTNFQNPMKMTPKSQYGTLGLTLQVPKSNSFPSDNSIQLMLNPSPSKFQPTVKVPQKNPCSNKPLNNRAYAVIRTADNLNQLSIRDFTDLSSLLTVLTEKKGSTKLLTKRSSPRVDESQLSENYKKFLTDLNGLSELSKSSYRKEKFAKRTVDENTLLPSSSFNELSTHSDANIKYLGNLLSSIMTRENPEPKAISAAPAESSDGGISESLEESLKSNKIYLKSDMPPDHGSKYHRRWSTTETKSMNNIRLRGDKAENNLLRSELGMSEDKNFQDGLLAELAASSDKITKLRREGAGTRKLRGTIEESLPFTGKYESVALNASPQKRSEKYSKLESESVGVSANDKTLFGYEHDMNESSDKSSMKSNYENHPNQFFENLNLNKNQKNQLNTPNENTCKKKKRKGNHRRKRSASRDVKNKVSTTAVQNTILKNLAEDNYQSIYSPGIIRRLFSTNNEAGDAENFINAYECDKNVIAVEAQPKCVKNSLNKCIDPLIVELFGAFDKAEEKNRARRSLTSGFHSNFKREIDLDESMPNDFQNFLVTSLGGFGSQNREFIKKDVALWERKESTQDSNHVVHSSLPGFKNDPNSTLEKREVPSSENRKIQTYSNSNSNMGDLMVTLNHPEKKLRPDANSKLQSQVEFADEKLPTQIRIQITNASSKEKKSSKPIMEESDTTSTEMENLPKKEFFDRNKIRPLRLNNHPKLHNLAKNKFSFSDYEEPENIDSSNPQTSYRLHRRRRKKKKYVPENPVKPIKDFIKFDQKTMETFLKSIMANQNMQVSANNPKNSINNPSYILPQVETVYNPTQGTDKAQLEVARLGRVSSANNKNMGTAKNNVQSPNSIGYDNLGNFLKDKTDKIKSDKLKEFEDIDWKLRYGKMRLRQEFGWGPSKNNYNLESMKIPMVDSNSFYYNSDTLPYTNPFSQHLYNQKNLASSNYLYQPSATSSGSSNTLHDAMKFKQEIKNQNALASKGYKKPFYYGNNGGLYKVSDKERNQNAIFSGLNARDSAPWNYKYSMKKPNNWEFKSRDFLASSSKNQNQLDSKSKIADGYTGKFMKSVDDDNSSVLNSFQSLPQLENRKDTDYLDDAGVEYYTDDDTGKELPSDEPLLPLKYHQLFNSEADDKMNKNEDEEEADEENSEEEYPEAYSLVVDTTGIDSDLMKNSRSKFQDSFKEGDALPQVNNAYPKEDLLGFRGHSFQQIKFTGSKNDAKFSHGHQQIPLVDMKTGVRSFSGSTGLLKAAKEHSSIFGKNLMKNIYDHNPDHLMPDEFPENKMKELSAFYHHNKILKRKIDSQGIRKRNRQYPQIGNRLFYATKTEVTDNDPDLLILQKQMARKARKGRHISCSRNPLNAEFADTENNLDNESEVNGNENLINLGKSLQEEVKKDKVTDRDEDAYLEDAAENLENDRESISEDNVLENVIGKYIMRKRVVSPADLNKPESLQTEGNHKLGKRSLWKPKCDVKVVKRLSSGHLTENNFRKYHKKNLTRKRDLKEFNFATHVNMGNRKQTLIKTRKAENTMQQKRSALDFFKKITNKDRDNKKVENVDGRTAGFEPLLSVDHKKYESSAFEFLNQARKLSNEGPQTQTKSYLAEFKQYSPYEGQFSDQRKNDKMKLTKKNVDMIGQGPWKIELNDRSDLNIVELPKSLESLKELDRLPAGQGNEHLKAFLVFSNNLRAFKRSTAEDLSPTSGSSQNEVGNIYPLKSDEGRRISKMHVRKKSSLDSSLVTNDNAAAQISTDHFTSGKIKETLVNIEKNRALQDTKSFSEGGSKSQPPHLLQRHNKNIRSFVNDDELGSDACFSPEGSSNNRKSLFPPSGDTNIMRDSRQVNEETSKYLGQQIVDVILSHVRANPKFKELIAPGLSAKRTACKEDVDIRKRPLEQVDISEQLQFFLQKFMHDLETLAESHLKKRMCAQIDDQSKEFLQSLLNISGSTKSTGSEKCLASDDYLDLENVEKESTTKEETTTETSKPESPVVPSLIPNSAGELENLKKRHCILLKLIDDYEKLSKLEKDSLSVHHQYLLEELQRTKKELRSINHTSSDCYEMTCPKFSNGRSKNLGFENAEPEKSFNTCYQSQNCTSFPRSQYPSQKWHCGNQPPSSQKPEALQVDCPIQIEHPKPIQVLPNFSFEEDAARNKLSATVKTSSPFEKIDHVKVTNSSGQNNMSYHMLNQNGDDSLFYSSPTSQSFDLLPFQNTTQKFDYKSFDQSPGSSESIRLQQSLSGVDNFENLKNPLQLQNPKRMTELNKLSLGDAAGLQYH